MTNVLDSRYASAFGAYSSKMPTAVGMSHMMTNMTDNNTLNIKANNSEKQSLDPEQQHS
jgi:hypothetical protein